MADEFKPLLIKFKDLASEETLKKFYNVVSKTKSIFNKDLRELPNIQRSVKMYLTQHPELGELPVRILPRFPNAYYNFGLKYFGIGLFSASIIAHEIEHALSVEKDSMYSHLLAKSNAVSNLTRSLSMGALGAGALRQGQNIAEKGKLILKGNTGPDVYDLATLIHGASSAPKLYEEGRANVLAILKSHQKLEALKTLAPAYGSYLASSALPIAMFQAAKKL